MAGATLFQSHIAGAKFNGADLSGVNFIGVESFAGTDFSGTTAWEADFSGTDLKDAIFDGTSIGCANFQGTDVTKAKVWKPKDEGDAIYCNTKLPAGSPIDGNRDCEGLEEARQRCPLSPRCQ